MSYPRSACSHWIAEQSVQAQTAALTRAVDRQISLRASGQRAYRTVSESVLSHHG